jgi:hypothetical protein
LLLEVIGELRKLSAGYSEELQKLHSSPYIIKIMTSKRLMCAGRVPSARAIFNGYNILAGKSE